MKDKILDVIHGHYADALVQLPLDDLPALAPRLLDAGVCFGFADPVTNIIANTVVCFGAEMRNKRKRKSTKASPSGEAKARDEVLSQIIIAGVPSAESRTTTVAELSLKGLVAFLTTYFRHLPTREAVRYLYLGRADLLAAVRLVELDRCLRRKNRFCILSHATKAALRCAALAAGVPMVDTFVDAMFGLVSHLTLVTQTVAAETRRWLSVQDIYRLSELLKKPLEIHKSDNPMDTAALRIPRQGIDGSIEKKKVSVELTESLRGVLLDRVHDLYLEAVSRLPMKEFQTHHHRGLLKAGYCYGPFRPVYNIIVNTIWYNTTFPTSEKFEVNMVCTMRHVEARSLNGLIAFLCASVPDISEHEAMVYLLKSDLKVPKAIQMAKHEHQTSGSDDIGYKAAVNASSHPRSEEFLEFVLQTWPKVLPVVKSVMKASHLISSDVIRLSSLLATNPNLLELPVELTKDALDMLSQYKKDFLTKQSIVRAKVEAALQKYEQSQGYSYELGVICVVNKYVGKKIGMTNAKKQYSHVNFWATRENEGRPTLFFAQFSNDEDSANHYSICYPVTSLSTHDVRCCYCEFEGIRIVHPIQVNWDGESDFEKISCGGHRITNANIISRGKLMDSGVGCLFEQHLLYLDPIWDCKFISSVNQTAWRATCTLKEIERSCRPKPQQAEKRS